MALKRTSVTAGAGAAGVGGVITGPGAVHRDIDGAEDSDKMSVASGGIDR